MTKKLVLLITTFLVTVTLVGCQNNDSKNEEKPAEQTTGKTIEKSSNDVSIQVEG